MASTLSPIGRSDRTSPFLVLITINFCGPRQPMNSRLFALSMATPTGSPPGATDQFATTFRALRSTTATSCVSIKLI